jgi:6-phosphogluconolactonase (cycloisomerase 2 family)
MESYYAYIGNWDAPKNQTAVGITTAAYSEETGFCVIDHSFPELNFGAACYDEALGVLYCVNERPQVPSVTLGGQVFALKVSRETGKLTELSRSPSYGPLPSYCAVDASHRYLVVTNHSGRNAITKTVQEADGSFRIVQEFDETAIVLFPLSETGEILPPCDIVRHQGHGALPNQQNPHAHCVKRSPDGNLFFVCDKGNDSVYTYRIDPERGKLCQCDQLASIPGSSPRYGVFHPTKPVVYYNHETKSILCMDTIGQDGTLTHCCTVSCLENGSQEERGLQSDLCIDAAGKTLYSLVRDAKTIAVFALDSASGTPTLLQTLPCGGKEAGRGLALSPEGKYLYLAAGRADGAVFAFAVAPDGRLTPCGRALDDVAPSVITFVRA